MYRRRRPSLLKVSNEHCTSWVLSCALFHILVQEDAEEKCKRLDGAARGRMKNNDREYVDGAADSASSLVERETSQENQLQDVIADEPRTARLLAFVQILTASFASFAHGSNDVR